MTADVGISPFPETAPLPIVSGRMRWRDSLSSLAFREYRSYAIGLLCASTGLWIARIATDWLILEITGDVAVLGIVIAVQLLPAMILSVWGGVVSDSLPARTSVIVTQVLFAFLFAWLGALALTGAVSEHWVFAISVLVGVVSCVDGPSRAVLTSQTVTITAFPNAISINAVVPQIGGVLGAGFAGIAISTLDVGWTLTVASVGLLAGALATLLIRPSRLAPRPRLAAGGGHIREALRYAARKPDILLSLVMVGVLAVSGLSASVLFAWMADVKFGTGAGGYSLYTTVGALGSFVGGMLSSRRRRFSVAANALLLAASGAAWIVCGFTPWPAAFAIGILVAAGIRFLFLVGNDALTQLSANPRIRGRVVSLYLMTATGGQVLGSVLLGWIVSRWGGDVGFVITGVVPLVVALAIWAVVARRRRLRAAQAG